jgi:hypothetical protein
MSSNKKAIVHFGSDELGILCKRGMEAGKAMAVSWEAVTCRKCRGASLEAAGLSDEVVVGWLESRVAPNRQWKAKLAQRQREMDQWRRRCEREEGRMLDELGGALLTADGNVMATVGVVGEEARWPRATKRLKVLSKASLDWMEVVVYLVRDAELYRVRVTWRDVLVGGRQVTVDEGLDMEVDGYSHDRLVAMWLEGAAAAGRRYEEKMAEMEAIEDLLR